MSSGSRAPAEQLRVFADYRGPVREEADVAVVGSGPCGAVAARELATRGLRVVLLEEGPPLSARDIVLDGALSMTRTMREAGLRATRGTVMPTMQAIVLGGGSFVNSAICVRAPDFVLDGWCEVAELSATSRKDLDPHYDAVAALSGVAPTPDEVQGRRNLLFRDGCRALGIPSEPIERNVRGCRGSGECFTGCRSRAKQSADLTWIPDAMRHGARVLTSVQIQELLHERGRVVGVAGRVAEPFTGRLSHPVSVRARAVVLAAGVMATPVLLQRSGNLANRSGQVGENLQFHPGVAATGIYPEPTDPWFGATQGYQSLHFVRDGFKLETLWAPPGVMSVRTPGFGHELKRRLAEIRRSATFDAIASCHRSLGRVRARRRGLDPAITWRLHPDDVDILMRALHVLCRLHFAAGAEKVLPGVHGAPDELFREEEAEIFVRRRFGPGDLVTAGNHVFGTTRMHGDPRRGVVDEHGRCHDVENLFILDTGIFPRSPGVNPMLTGMALARRGAHALADQLGGRSAPEA